MELIDLIQMPNHTLQMTNGFYTIYQLHVYHQFTRTQPFEFFNGPAKYTQHTCTVYNVHGMHKKLHSFTTFAICCMFCFCSPIRTLSNNTSENMKDQAYI